MVASPIEDSTDGARSSPLVTKSATRISRPAVCATSIAARSSSRTHWHCADGTDSQLKLEDLHQLMDSPRCWTDQTSVILVVRDAGNFAFATTSERWLRQCVIPLPPATRSTLSNMDADAPRSEPYGPSRQTRSFAEPPMSARCAASDFVTPPWIDRKSVV